MEDEMKLKLFERMLNLEKLGEMQTNGKLFDHVNYIEMSNGAYEMLRILGLDREYIRWSYGK